MKIIFILLQFVYCFFVGCSENIPITKKVEYGSKMNAAFSWQAAGQSTIAFAVFEDGYRLACQAGEAPKKLEPIRQLFFWYRAHGYRLGLTAPPAHDYDRIYGADCKYQSYKTVNSISSTRDEVIRDARRREYLMGVSEIISGLLGVWLIPSATAKRIAGTVAIGGVRRLWNIYQDVQTERDLALLELRKITNQAEIVALEE